MSANLFTVPPGTPFVDAVAAGLLARAGGDPIALADTTVLLPTRRACRSLREAFLRVSGGDVLLLPAMRPLGDVEEDQLVLAAADADWEGAAETALRVPPAISPVRRRLMLAELVLRRDRAAVAGGAVGMQPDQALFLAGELAGLLDHMQIEEVPFAALDGIVPDALAAHWQETLKFLRIVTETWPAVLAELGVIDPADRRRRLMDAQAESWTHAPPPGPIVAAGSTGSIPATARLLTVVAKLPRGAVVLPGLDRGLSDEAWEELEITHPQAAMRGLLDRMGAVRADVADWEGPGVPTPDPARAELVSAVMRPAVEWRGGGSGGGGPSAVAGLHRMELPGPEEEARAVALVLREALATPGRTAALATPDRGLARRVAAELSQWGVEADDSGGLPLALTRVGAFLRLTAEMVAEQAVPVALLAALKHPLAAGGAHPHRFRIRVRQLEGLVLRGLRPAPGFGGLLSAVRTKATGRAARLAGSTLAWLERVARWAEPLAREIARDRAPLAALVAAHLELVEALAADRVLSGAQRLWAGDDGEAAALWIDELLRTADSAPRFPGSHYPAVLTELMADIVVRPRWPRHPRIHIWGLLEARLQQADVLVLGGLNEGVWPPDPGADPWFSRPMRTAAGLPQRERRIGLSAHDFAQAAAAPQVVLSRATKIGGEPTVASRWLVRLEAMLRGSELSLPPAPWAAWQAELHDPGPPAPLPPPAPRPPLAARPRRLSATRIEVLASDPYGVYGRHVLSLRKAEDLDADPDAAHRGRFVHQAIDAFLKEVGESLPPDALDMLLRHGRAAFDPVLDLPNVRAFWWPRFERAAEWFIGHQRDRCGKASLVGSEVCGEMTLDAPGGGFILTATADRLDRLHDGGLAIVDYKTGTLPQGKEIASGYKPQLLAEAVLAEAGGFGEIFEQVREVEFWKLDGRGDGGFVWSPKGVAGAIAAAREGIRGLVAAFDDPAMPYLSRPRPEVGPRFSDYDHLARVQEWSAGAKIEDGR